MAKKKKKKIVASVGLDGSINEYTSKPKNNKVVAKVSLDGDIAPIKTTTKKKDDRLFSAFDDGYDLGDVTKTILKVGKRVGETAWDTTKKIGTGLATDPIQTIKTVGVSLAEGVDNTVNAIDDAGNDFFDWLLKREDNGKIDLDIKEQARLSYASDEEKQSVLNQYAKDYGTDSKEYKQIKEFINLKVNKDPNAIENILNPKYYLTDTYKAKQEGTLSEEQQEIYGMGQQIGEMLPSVGLSMINPALGTATFYVKAQQNYTDEAKARGYSDKDARTYGLIMGGAETLVERLGFDQLGGLGKLSKGNILRNMAGEGLEEFIMPYIDSTVKSVGYGEEFDIEASTEEAIEGGVMGAFTSLIMSSGGKGLAAVDNFVNKVNTGQQITQEDFVNAGVELQEADPNAIAEVMESVPQVVQQEIQKAQEQEQALKQQNYQYVPKDTDSQQRRTISEDASKYANNTPRTQEFIDLVVNTSEASGINFRLANNEAELIAGEKNKLIEKYAKNNNVSIEEATKRFEKTTIDAYNNGEIVINIDSPKALNRLVGHEVTHSLEGTKEYSNLQRIATEYAKTKGEYDSRIADLQSLYEGTNADIENELTSDLIGDYLFTDQEFINRIHTEDRNLFQRIYDEIKHLYKMATAGSKEARQLEQLKHSFEKAMRENKQNATDINVATNQNVEIVENAQLEDKVGENISQNAQKTENIVQKEQVTKRTTPSQEELDNLEDIRQNKSGSEYADAFYSLEKKYGKANLYKGLNSYKTTGKALEYSLSDNKGRNLSKEQQEFFKDSKVRDSEGRLREVYHWTQEDFTTFDKDMIGSANSSTLLEGFYFANTPPQGNNGKVMSVYLDIKNPMIFDMDKSPYTVVETQELIDNFFRGETNPIYEYLIEYEGYSEVEADKLIDKWENADGVILKNTSYDIHTEEYIVFEPNQIKNVDNLNPTSDPDIRYSLSEDTSIDDKINSSMTMDEAREMLQRAFVLSDIKEYSDGEVTNIDEWVNSDTWAYQIPMIIENDYNLQSKYINANPDIVDNEIYTIDDVIEAYKNGTLVGKQKTSKRLDLTKDTGYIDDRFYAPKEITEGIELYNRANQRVTNSNRNEVYKARGEFIIASHNKGYIESLGLTQAEVNKKLKSWSEYTAKARNLSNYFNEGIPTQNKWTGIENSSIVNTLGVSEAELKSLVKEIKGTSYDFERQYITSTMLALDTHIDYKNLTFDFSPDRSKMSKRALADYDSHTDVIRVSQSGQNTIAHEIGHYIDHLWGRDIFKNNLGITNRTTRTEGLTTDQINFVNNFYKFLDSIESTADTGSAYKMSPTEVFARFTARFVEWTKMVATNNRYGGYEAKWYDDKFNEGQYREFVKILQEKAVLDTTNAEYSLSNENTDIAPTNADIFGSEIKLQQQVQEAIAPLQETIQELNEKITTLQENIAPIKGYTDEDISLSNQRNIENLEAQEIAPIEDTSPDTMPTNEVVTDPFEDRDIKAVGNRKVNAYMYENPEVKPFFQQAANEMLGDLNNSIKGEKVWIQELNQDTGLYEESMVTGTQRLTTDDIAELLDVYHYTYDQIRKGLNAIIEDNGKENNAVSKRIEFMLNDRLLNGYKSVDGFPIPPNNEYRALLQDKNIQEYTEQAYAEWNKSINQDELAPSDIEYVSNSIPEVQNVPLENDLAPNNINTLVEQKQASNEPRIENIMFADPTESLRRQAGKQVAEEMRYTKTSSKVTKTKKQMFGDAWGKLREQFFNSFHYVDKFARDTGNQQIKFNTDMYNNVYAEINGELTTAQTDNYGNPIGEALLQPFEEAKANGEYEQLNDYLMHYSNIDRHNAGKGSVVPLEYSRKMIAAYDKANPNLNEYARRVWRGYKNDLANMQANGLISGQFNSTLQKMYPHYNPFMFEQEFKPSMEEDGVVRPKKVIKKAEGGAFEILEMEEARVRYTQSVRSAIRKNDVLKEIVKTSKDKISIGADVRIDPTDINQGFGIDEKGKYYATAYVDGQTQQATISEDMYRELTQEGKQKLRALEDKYALITKPLQAAGKLRRNLLTTWSPTFMITNPIKDIQDASFNSKYTKDFAKYYPTALPELARAKTDLAKQFLTLYGTGNNFGEYTETSKYKKNGKFINNVVNAVPNFNNLVELAPRFAEFKASLDNGANLQEAMYNAREVTVNFGRGGYVAKALNRNGFTFFNASLQGFDKLARNFSGENGAKGVVGALSKVAILGVAPALFNALAFGVGDDEDEDYKALPDYIKDNYYLIKTGDGEFIRIPKGRMLSIFGSAARRTLEYTQGEKDAFEGYLTNAYSQVGVQNPLESNIFAPLIQAKNNKTWYGGDLVPTRLQDKPVEEQWDESTDEFSKWLGQQMGISPYKINYVLDQYSGGIGDLLLPTITEEATSDGSFLAPIKDKFTANTTFDNKYVSEFYGTRDKMEVKANGSKATEEDVLRSKYLDSVSWEMSELYKEKREVQSNSNLTKAEKFERVQEIQKQINSLAEEGLNNYENINKTSSYAIVGDREFYKDANNEWRTPYDDELEELNSLGMDVDDKSAYFEAKNSIYNINEKYRGTEDTYEDRKRDIINVVRNSRLNTDYKSYLYGKYYSEDTTKIVNMLGIDFNAYLDYETQNFVADKDENGKSISGSKKKKVFNYINSMNIGFEEKVILAKLQYESYDEYNHEIINYLNNHPDISYEEMEFILKKLGFDVDTNGNIYW